MENQEIEIRAVEFTKTDGEYTLSGLVEVPRNATEEQIEAAAQAKFDAMIARIEFGEQIGELHG